MWYDLFDPPPGTTVSVIGSPANAGITSSQTLTYDSSNQDWSYGVNLGSTLPTGLPYIYTFTIDSTTKTVTVSCFLNSVPTNLAPSGTIATLTPTFSWTGISASDALYDIEVSNSSGTRMWRKENISGTSVVYNADGTGTALTSGATYYINLDTHSRNTCPDGISEIWTTITTQQSGYGGGE